MVRIDDLLEQIRRQLSRYSLLESLFVMHAQMQYLQFNVALPSAIGIDPAVAAVSGYDRNCYEWDIDLLSRELLQYAPMAGQFSLTHWNEFANTVNLFRNLDDTISQRTGKLLQDNILLEIGRIAYREFPWQEHPNHWRLTRYYKIFGDAAVDAIIEAEMGLTALPVMQKKLAGERTKWNMKSFLLSEFGDEVGRIDNRGLFPGELESIHTAIRMPEVTPPDITPPR